jgi:hypothetical protein
VIPGSYRRQPGKAANTLSEVDLELLKASLVAMESLKLLRRVHENSHDSNQIRQDIISVSRWMEFLLDQREHTDIETGTQTLKVMLGGRIVCHECRKSASDHSETRPQEGPVPAPIWARQVDFLLACTNQVGRELFVRGCASNDLRQFPKCLTTLRTVLSRLRRYSHSEAPAPNIEVQHSSDACARCGKPMTLSSEIF